LHSKARARMAAGGQPEPARLTGNSISSVHNKAWTSMVAAGQSEPAGPTSNSTATLEIKARTCMTAQLTAVNFLRSKARPVWQ